MQIAPRGMSHTYRMSVVQACAETEAAIQRARSLFASEPEPAAGALNGGSTVQTAAQSTTTAGQITSDLSGAFIATHKAFVEQSASRLSAGAQTDADLQSHTVAAATLTQAGARRLDAIAAETRATSQAAATASSPAADRAIPSPCAPNSPAQTTWSPQPSSRRPRWPVKCAPSNTPQPAMAMVTPRPSGSGPGEHPSNHRPGNLRTAKTRATGSTSARSSTSPTASSPREHGADRAQHVTIPRPTFPTRWCPHQTPSRTP